MNDLFQNNDITFSISSDEVSSRDKFSPHVFSKIRKAIEIEIRNRPKGKDVVIEEGNQIKFVETNVL